MLRSWESPIVDGHVSVQGVSAETEAPAFEFVVMDVRGNSRTKIACERLMPGQTAWPVYLSLDGSGKPILSDREARGGRWVLAVEPAREETGEWGLAIASLGREGVRINGSPAPLVAVLHSGDWLSGDGETCLQLVAGFGIRIMQADAAHAERTCTLCRGAICVGARISLCPCGAIFHCDEGVAERDGAAASIILDCAGQYDACPRCGRGPASACATPKRPGDQGGIA